MDLSSARWGLGGLATEPPVFLISIETMSMRLDCYAVLFVAGGFILNQAM